ncbi:MAG: DNA polymerase Y family protein [Verrucomicrobiota bacterium]
MFAAWRLPQFMLQALKVPAQAHAVVLDGQSRKDSPKSEDGLLLCVSRPAEDLGVHVGMSASQAMARCPGITSVYRDEAAEKELQDRLLKCAEAWTADFESTHPGLCVLDLRRVHHRQQPSWLDQGLLMHQDVREHGHEICVGFAETADLALLASHVAFPVKVIRDSMTDEKAAFLELPLTVLSPTVELQHTLRLWGIHTLGELKALKRQAVGERLGPAGLALWDLAHGGKERLLKLVRPPVHYRQDIELESGIETLEPLMHVLRDFSQRLCSQLSLAWKAASSLHFQLGFEDGSSHAKDLRIAEPTRDVEVLLRLLETHLESLKASAPVMRISLEITPVNPSAAQDLLFDRGLRDPAKFAETLSALEALLGHDRAGRGQLLPTHQPDAFVVTPFLEKPSSGEQPAETHRGLPLLRFRPSWKAEVQLQDTRPVWLRSGHLSMPLTGCHGPWFLSGHWWDARHAWAQEVWDVASQEGGLYRLVREKGTWRLEGRYG